MNWFLISLLSSFGLIMGLLAINGYTQKIEPILWLLMTIFATLVLSKNNAYKPFLHGLLIGLAWGILNGFIQSLFFDSYMANNPLLRKNFDKVTFMPPRYFPLLTGPIMGLVAGGVLGGLTILIRRIFPAT
ncbi:MAG: hypothetical protein H7Y42_17285 [Chitinophagaceae bacterium]|nr:hypothetical protein [Chitinophagaceae bacterium]